MSALRSCAMARAAAMVGLPGVIAEVAIDIVELDPVANDAVK